MASIKLKRKNKEYANGEYPIVLQIIKDRKSKIISLGFLTKIKNWDSREGLFKSNHPNYKVLNAKLDKLKLKARLIIVDFEEENHNFSLEEFEHRFRTSTTEALSVFEFWDEIIAEMEATNRFGNAKVNRDTARSILKFAGTRKLNFAQINVHFLEKYEVYLRTNGGSSGGIGVKMRVLRALYNSAVRRGFVKKSKYPFTQYKVSKLRSNPNRRALPLNIIKKIEALDNLSSSRLINARNYFVFSFYTRGMNFADMANLKWSDISDGNIYYRRLKTRVNFIIKILPPIQKILDYYQVNGNETNYIFPILYRENYSPKQIQNRKRKMLKEYNSDLKHIAALCNLNTPPTSYTARHSFANCLKQNGTPTDIISESMGHQNPTVTQSYLKTFANTILDNACETLVN